MPLVQDWLLDLLTSSPARYHCTMDAPWNKIIQCYYFLNGCIDSQGQSYIYSFFSLQIDTLALRIDVSASHTLDCHTKVRTNWQREWEESKINARNKSIKMGHSFRWVNIWLFWFKCLVSQLSVCKKTQINTHEWMTEWMNEWMLCQVTTLFCTGMLGQGFLNTHTRYDFMKHTPDAGSIAQPINL